MHTATAAARFMDTPDRLGAAYTMRSRAYQWVAACTTTPDTLAAFQLVQWSQQNHANQC